MTVTGGRVCVVTPVLDDWACLRQLAGRLTEVLGRAGWSAMIVAVDDGSNEAAPVGPNSGASVIVRLNRNVGHQRAIAIGLDYVLRETDAEIIAVIDSDGEDRPEDLPSLLSALVGPGGIVVASRRKRSEGRRFAAFYLAYKAAFRIFTGEALDFGNFSVLDRIAARRLVSMHELWLNYPATIMRSRLPFSRIPTDRGSRISGHSRMNLVGLVMHGLSAIGGVFSERAFTRTLVTVGILVGVMTIGLMAGLALKVAGLATPGWVTTIAVALIVVLVQTAIVTLGGLLIVFGNANNVVMSPSLSARTLIRSVEM